MNTTPRTRRTSTAGLPRTIVSAVVATAVLIRFKADRATSRCSRDTAPAASATPSSRSVPVSGQVSFAVPRPRVRRLRRHTPRLGVTTDNHCLATDPVQKHHRPHRSADNRSGVTGGRRAGLTGDQTTSDGVAAEAGPCDGTGRGPRCARPSRLAAYMRTSAVCTSSAKVTPSAGQHAEPTEAPTPTS